MLAHRAAWVLCRGAIPEGMQVLHNCPGGDNPACVKPDHLWLGTQMQNIQDALNKGRFAYGEMSGAHKLTEAQVLAMRLDYDNGMTRTEVAEKYGTSKTNAFSIIHRQTWTHI